MGGEIEATLWDLTSENARGSDLSSAVLSAMLSVPANFCLAFRSVFSNHCLLEIAFNLLLSGGSVIQMKQPRLEK